MLTNKFGVLMLTWEFPPRIVGGISSHVHDLSLALARMGAEVHVLTCDFPDAPKYEEIQGVHVYRFGSYEIQTDNFLSWVLSMNDAMTQHAMQIMKVHSEKIDLIHAHDWLVAKSAVALRNMYRKPLVSTMHSTEVGRSGEPKNDYQKRINHLEKRLINESSAVICCSNYMTDQIVDTFNTSRDKIFTIQNGVGVSKFSAEVDAGSIRRRYATQDEKIILYVGRLVHEKGVHVLISAVPKVLSEMPNVTFLIVGEGEMKEFLMEEASRLSISRNVFFTGFVDDPTLVSIYKASDAAVVPSLYEPFGITALEAMAAKTPVIVSDTGGLAEIVEHEKTGIKTYPNNPESLAKGILRVLKEQCLAETIRKNAYQKTIEDHDWNIIAERTKGAYRNAAVLPAPVPPFEPETQLPIIESHSFSEEFKLLLLLYNLGSVSTEKARSSEELSAMLRVDEWATRERLQRLVCLGYIQTSKSVQGEMRHYLTGSGIIRVCSMFS